MTTLAALKRLEYVAAKRKRGFDHLIETALSEQSAPEDAEPIYRELGLFGATLRDVISHRQRNFAALKQAMDRRGQT